MISTRRNRSQTTTMAGKAWAALTAGGLLISAQLFTAPPAYACAEGQLQDTVTGMCWSQSGQGETFGAPADGPCLPGRLGNCLGTLQKSVPSTGGSGRNSAVPCGYGPEGGFPCGYW
ncbi:MAG: hypothetical protein KIH64_011385 [Mycobacterium sp.]|nr:hypothetical protein [Mycobacterium sp.]